MPTIKTKVSFLKELLALKEVIDLGQIHAAADRNGIKHSNMSKMLTDLESRFKTALLIRGSAGCLPTNASRQLYNDIELISDEEISKSIELVLIHKQNLTTKQVAKEASRNFGFKSTSKKTADRINSVLDLMIANNKVKITNDIVEIN